MRTSRVISLILAYTVVAVAAVGAPLHAQSDDVCGVYAAAMGAEVPDTVRTLVVYDSVSLATPQFAFHGWSGMGLPRDTSPVPLRDSTWEQMRATYRGDNREALPTCFGAGKTVVRVPYDSLINQFKNRDSGWVQFGRTFPGARGFYVVGRPYFLNAARSEALLYVASAYHWLAGYGHMWYLRKVDGVWKAVASHSLWVS